MILTKENILDEVGFVPALDEFQVNPHSIDVRLLDGGTIASGETKMFKTAESVKMPNNVMAVVYPRSSANRRGLQIHMTGIVDANYEGQLVVPITNCAKEAITLLKGERVASLVFQRLERQATLRLSKYHGSKGDYRPDKDVETSLLALGSVDELKAKYAL